jgi:hypothetical protein
MQPHERERGAARAAAAWEWFTTAKALMQEATS